MTLAATFLGGAKSRLLPPSVPFRFFAAAAIFHVLLWLVLLRAAGAIVTDNAVIARDRFSYSLVLSPMKAARSQDRRPLRSLFPLRQPFCK